ncbi:hypothetical protein CBR_g9102 [Chara braunii]|uniref:Protein arginine N-methyltransferase PRMT10 n=1 Tax=Chara braunii TaxID=69332 RepID=A0A388KNQ8_CHABU|nr:hypothetical protein CBR_g9102 [Chara braunii]|eukprot:GBG71689.1 hypothetical protein CBR_g9102 [Chara braunii]
MEPDTKRAPVDKGADFANYFCTYGFLYHQKEMLSDRVRMEAYHSAIFRNARHFRGKVVLDVGTGSGILAVWAAQAGAKKVYAVETTDMANQARKVAEGNNVACTVEVIQASIEDVTLPEKVDIIISEWMGYFLLRESMFDSVIIARDRWLKPGGAMYPSHARMFLAPMRSALADQKMQEFQHSMADWDRFVLDTREQFGVDMSCLAKSYEEEQKKYYLQTSLWNSLYPNQLLGAAAVIKEIDCLTATVNDISTVDADFSIPLYEGVNRVSGYSGWFDVHFRGSPAAPADSEVQLDTAPSLDETTHWGQQVFLMHPPLRARGGDVLAGKIQMTRSKDNHRLMDVKLTNAVERGGRPLSHPVTALFYIE